MYQSNAVARDHVAVDQLAVRVRLEREVDGGVDQRLTGGDGHAAGGGELRDHRREIATGRVAGHGHASGIGTELASACARSQR